MIKKILSAALAAAVILNAAAFAESASMVKTGPSNSYILMDNGQLLGAGKNNNGQLGSTGDVNKVVFEAIYENAKDVSGGGEHTLVLTNDNALFGSGNNIYGQLGLGDTANRGSFTKITEGVLGMSAGNSHSLIVKNDGSVWGFGYNAKGILDDGSTETRTLPVKLFDGAKDVFSGLYINIALMNNSTVKIFPDRMPAILSTDIVSAEEGREHVVLLDKNGDVYTMGSNVYGQLGNGTKTDSDKTIKVMEGVKKISAGATHTFAIKNDNTLWGFGNNLYGQLGDGTAEERVTPTFIMTDVVDVSTNTNHTIVLRKDGSVYAFGKNDFGQFGNSSYNSSVFPLPVYAFDQNKVSSDWAFPEIEKAKFNNLAPDFLLNAFTTNITRQEFAAMAVYLYEAITKTKIEAVSSPFKDTSDEYVAKAFSKGIVKGVNDEEFDPGANVTRQEICTMYLRAIKAAVPDVDTAVTENITFADENLIDSWALDAVKFGFSRGIVKGVGDNMVDPLGNSTREQSMALNLRTFNKFAK